MFKKITCSIISILFIFQGLAYPLAPPMASDPPDPGTPPAAPGAARAADTAGPSSHNIPRGPDTRRRMLATAGKLFGKKSQSALVEEWGKEKGFKQSDAISNAKRKYGDTHGFSFYKPSIPVRYTYAPPIHTLDETNRDDLIIALESYARNEAHIPQERLKIKEGYFYVDKEAGQLPIASLDPVEPGSDNYVLTVHTEFVQTWNEIRKNDRWFFYDISKDKPVDKKRELRLVSVAWALFYRLAKHEIGDLVSRDGSFSPKSTGHMTNLSHRPYDPADGPESASIQISDNEYSANMIGGNYRFINDAIWLWFLSSYSVSDEVRYNNKNLANRIDWIFNSDEANKLGLPNEFPLILDDKTQGKEKRLEWAKDIALAFNQAYFDRPDITVPEFTVEDKYIREYQKTAEYKAYTEWTRLIDSLSVNKQAMYRGMRNIDLKVFTVINEGIGGKLDMSNDRTRLEYADGSSLTLQVLTKNAISPDWERVWLACDDGETNGTHKAHFNPDGTIKVPINGLKNNKKYSFITYLDDDPAKPIPPDFFRPSGSMRATGAETNAEKGAAARDPEKARMDIEYVVESVKTHPLYRLFKPEGRENEKGHTVISIYDENVSQRKDIIEIWVNEDGQYMSSSNDVRVCTDSTPKISYTADALADRVEYAIKRVSQNNVRLNGYIELIRTKFETVMQENRIADIVIESTLRLLSSPQIRMLGAHRLDYYPSSRGDLVQILFNNDTCIRVRSIVDGSVNMQIAQARALGRRNAGVYGVSIEVYDFNTETAVDGMKVEIKLEPQGEKELDKNGLGKLMAVRDDFIKMIQNKQVEWERWADKAGEDYLKDEPLRARFVAMLAKDRGPGRDYGNPLTINEERGVFKAVNELKNHKIEILVAQKVNIDDDVKSAVKNMGISPDNVKITPCNTTNLEQILRRKEDDVKRIILVDGELALHIQYLMEQERGKTELFRDVKVVNLEISTEGAKSGTKLKQQARAVMFAVLARLLGEGDEETDQSIEAILKDLIREGTFANQPFDETLLPKFLSYLRAKEDRDTGLGQIQRRVFFFLHERVKLSEDLGRQLRFMRMFWTYA